MEWVAELDWNTHLTNVAQIWSEISALVAQISCAFNILAYALIHRLNVIE